ncbi:MAG: hypothetical protein HUN04_00530 [Desulfobacter sp.]|nr:MAG: hypothetical protein HUN04_00530 [Desulfobacter sp.]
MRMIIMIIIAAGFIGTLCSGCSSRLNKDYDYKTVQSNFSEGRIIAKLIGTYETYENETLRTSPYEIFLAIESNTKEHIAATLKNVKLTDADSRKIAFSLEVPIEKKFVPDSNGSFSAYFSIKGLDIKYVNYELLLNFEISGDDKSKLQKRMILHFKKAYKEHRSNDFIEKIMSV